MFSGRLSRFPYAILCIASLVIYFVIISTFPDFDDWLVSLGISILLLPFAIKRLHDFGMSGWLSIFLFIPVVGLIFGGGLMLQNGDMKSNKYGSPSK